MTLYAHATSGTIDALGQPSATAYDGTRWWDLRTLDPAGLAATGWAAVVEVPRPADTATTTTDLSYALISGAPTQVWTERPWTQAELDQQARQAVATQLVTATSTDLTKLNDAITALATLLADDTVAGSLRAIMGPSTAAAGTTTLRALKAQSNTAVVAAASIKGLINCCIDVCQRVIDGDQASRRVARQTLRLARQMAGDYTSAHVGLDI